MNFDFSNNAMKTFGKLDANTAGRVMIDDILPRGDAYK